VLEAVPPEARPATRGVILPMAWMPVTLYTDLLEAIEQVLGHGDGTHAMHVGEATAARDLPERHRVFVQTATPANAVRRIPQLWSSYYDGSAATVHGPDDGTARVEIRGLAPAHRLHAMAAAGFFRTLVELTGARDVLATVTAAAHRGDDYIGIALRWD
jgi:hypothetical protein